MTPEVSVVLAVRNGGEYLRAALDSILEQQGVNFECIVVDDGSTDGTPALLQGYAAHCANLRVVTQANHGLTRSLQRGCAAARGEFIARQDADDVSAPGRLLAQVALLRSDASLTLVATWGRMIGPRNEFLYEEKRPLDPDLATSWLRNGKAAPLHGSVAFRRTAYEQVGGYRAAFHYAQDWDLWLRLTEIGRLAYVPESLYTMRVDAGSITSHWKPRQTRLVELAQQCARLRGEGRSEEYALAQAAQIVPQAGEPKLGSPKDTAYFIGKCLLDRRDRRALSYLRESTWGEPWKVKRWVALGMAVCLCKQVPESGAATS